MEFRIEKDTLGEVKVLMNAMAIENWLKEKIYYRNTEIKE